MSSKKNDKNKKSSKEAKDSKRQEDASSGDGNESACEPVHEKLVDLRTVVITINSFRNIVPLYPVSEIRASLKYLDREIGETRIIPVTDDEQLVINESFELQVDINSPRQVDFLASYPVFVSAIQSSGSMEPELYEQLQRSEEVDKSVEQVESLFSMYEVFTGERLSFQLEKKKAKKEKSESRERDKSNARSKSATSRESKSSKKSRSKTSLTGKKTARSQDGFIKSEIYGMCVIDFIPLFYGETSFTEALLIQPVKKSCQILSTFKNFPEVSVTVLVKDNKNLLEDIRNILYFTVESICNVPTVMATDMDCKVCAVLPLQNQTTPVIFHNPKVTTKDGSKETPKRWPGIHDIGYNANTTKYMIENNFDAITNKHNLNLEEAFKEEALRIEYNYLKRNLMFKNGHNDFAAHVLSRRYLVLEIFLTPKTKKSDKTTDTFVDAEEYGPQTKSKVTKIPPYFHMLAVLDMVKLLYPGVTKLHFAAPLQTFTYEEAAKYGLDDSFFMPKPKSDIGTRSSKTKLDKGSKKKGEKKDDHLNDQKNQNKQSKKDKASVGKEEKNLNSQLPAKPEEPPPPEPSLPVYSEDGKPCFIVVEFELLVPLTAKRDIEELKAELHSLQMQTLHSSKTILNKHVAQDFYVETIREIVNDINKNWVKYNEAMNVIPRPKHQEFTEYLQRVGAYQSYLNSIITAATMIITNKYKCQETDFKNSKTYQNLLSEVFTDLISQMHKVLNNMMCSGMKPVAVKYSTPADISFFYAKEAAELKLYELADRYFLERIVDDQKPDFWFDYAVYNLEIGQSDKAFECVKESIALNATNKYALLLYGALLADKNNTSDAEICFLNIMILDSKWEEGWCILYLFYHQCGRQDGMEMALDMGRKSYYEETIVNDYLENFQDLAWSYSNIPKTMFFRTAILLLKLRLYSWVELALAEEVLVPKHYGYVNYMLAIVSYYKKDYEHALEHISEAKESLGADNAIMGLSGHALFWKGNLKEALNEYFHIIESYNRPDDIHIVYLNSAEILAKQGDHQKARKLLLTTCKLHQTPYVWFSAGKLYFEENDMLSAEECLNEANMKDNRHPEIWGYLALVSLKLNRLHEAEQCYQQAVKCNLDNESLSKSIVDGFQRASS